MLTVHFGDSTVLSDILRSLLRRWESACYCNLGVTTLLFIGDYMAGEHGVFGEFEFLGD